MLRNQTGSLMSFPRSVKGVILGSILKHRAQVTLESFYEIFFSSIWTCRVSTVLLNAVILSIGEQVKTIPFPYAKPEQYEQAMAQPLCREWTTEVAHRELTKPKVVLKAGRIIKPINQDTALLREKDALRLLTGKKEV